MPQTITKNKPAKLEFTEVGKAGQDLLGKYGLSNENPTDLIATKGMTYIEEIERDTHVKSCLQTRRQKLIKKGWRIVPGKSLKNKSTARDIAIADFIKVQLNDMVGSLEKDIEGMLDCISKGFSLTEINYQPLLGGRYQGKIGLKSLRFKPAKYFSFKFDQYGHYNIVQIDPDINGKILPSEKFIHLINGYNDENPYGESLTASAAFWVWLKKNEAKFWAIFSERYGMPIAKGTVPRKATPDDKSTMDDILQDIQTESGIRVPEGFDVEFLEATRSGDVNYDNFIERCNKEISKVYFGATLISEEGKRGQGSYALGATHVEVLEDYITFDAVLTSVAINEQLLRRFVNANFITDYYPSFEWLGLDIAGLISLSQSLGILVDKGLKVPTNWVYEKSGIPIPKEDEEILKPGPGGGGFPSARPDNRSPSSFIESAGINFADLPDDIQDEVREMDRLHNRYLKMAESQHEGLLKKIQNVLKKKE